MMKLPSIAVKYMSAIPMNPKTTANISIASGGTKAPPGERPRQVKARHASRRRKYAMGIQILRAIYASYPTEIGAAKTCGIVQNAIQQGANAKKHSNAE